MTSQQIRLLIAVLMGVAFVIWFFVDAFFSPLKTLLFSPGSLAFVSLGTCLLVIVLYLLLGTGKKESLLRKGKQWDSPRIVVITAVLVWCLFGAVYYFRPSLIYFFFPTLYTILIAGNASIRNAYRKELKI